MIEPKIAKVIRYVLDLDITYLETFQGYKGDTVLKIVMDSNDIKKEIARFAFKAGLDVKADYELDGKFAGRHNIFIAYSDPEIYQLKG